MGVGQDTEQQQLCYSRGGGPKLPLVAEVVFLILVWIRDEVGGCPIMYANLGPPRGLMLDMIIHNN